MRAVLRDPAFQRSLRHSLADRILLWFVQWYERLRRAFHDVPGGRSVALGLAALLALFVIARVVLASRAREDRQERTARRRGARAVEDPWSVAEEFAAQGQYEMAAHALYRGVILSLARDERLRLDASMTSGDYARELGRRGAQSFAAFRTFTRRLDVAIYGRRGCDDTAFQELRELSAVFRRRARAA